MVIWHKLTETQLLSFFVFISRVCSFQMAKKGKGIMAFLAKPEMIEPFDSNYVGKYFTVMGTFWPGGTPAVNATEYRMRIIGVNRTFKGFKGKTVVAAYEPR